MNILIKWTDDFKLDIQRIDEQHKKLVDMINILYDSIDRNEKDDVLEQIISDMLDYAFVHFKEEEKYFFEFGYLDTDSHIADHQFFLKKAREFMAGYRPQNLELKHKILNFLKEWLTHHILYTDKKYRDCFINGGLR